MMMVENGITAPILPIGLQSLTNGHIMPEPCPYSMNVMPCGSEARAMGAAPTNVDVSIQRNASVVSEANTPIVIDPDVEIHDNRGGVVDVASNPVSTSIECETAAGSEKKSNDTLKTRSSQDKRIILKLKSIIKKRLAKKFQFKKSKKNVVAVNLTVDSPIASELPVTEYHLPDPIESLAIEQSVGNIVTSQANIEQTTTGTESSFAPMPRNDFVNYLEQQPSTSTNVFEPPVNRMIEQQQSYGFISNVNSSEHSYVSSIFHSCVSLLKTIY